jgi:DNA-directed RNA polymerase specialized sigma24 family protein
MHLVTSSATVASVAADRLSASEPAISLSAGELCERYAARVYHFASMVAGSDLEAEDLAQSALERALRGLPRFDSRKGQVEAWLWRIVVNVARDAGEPRCGGNDCGNDSSSFAVA